MAKGKVAAKIKRAVKKWLPAKIMLPKWRKRKGRGIAKNGFLAKFKLSEKIRFRAVFERLARFQFPATIKFAGKMTLAARISFFAVATVSVLLLAAFSYLAVTERNKDRASARSNSEAIAMQSASEVKVSLDGSLDSARSLAQSLGAYESFPEESRREICSSIVRNYVVENESILGAWVCFKPNTIDGMDAQYANTEGHDGTGRFIPSWARSNGKISFSALVDYDKKGAGDYVLRAFGSGRESVLEPYEYEIDGEKVLLTTFSVPVKNSAGKIVAVAGINISLDTLNDMEFSTGNYSSAQTYLLSNDGIYVIHSDGNLVGKTMSEMEPESEKAEDILAAIKNGSSYVTEGISESTGEKSLKTMAPIIFGSTSTPWSLGFSVSMREVTAASNTNLIILVLLFFVLVAFVALAISFSVRKTIKKPLAELVAVAEQQAKGNYDLKICIDREDELGVLCRAFQTMNNRMNDLLSNLKIAASQVAAGARQISDSSVELSQGATAQAASLAQLTDSTEKIAAQTNLNAGNAGEANTLAMHTKSYAENGNQQMQGLLGAMERINVSSKDISKIIKVIEDIAFQTNILALNAAVEAAHAGQYGKGFAVVAQEVRNLAARSAAAAEETAELIEESTRKAAEGSKLAGETAVALHSIVAEVNQLAALMHTISVASNEQADGIAQINKGILQVSHVVQANSALAQESANASKELSGQAEVLRKQASRFHLRDDHKEDLEDLEDMESLEEPDFPAAAGEEGCAL